jgi:hypothetical protein
MRILRSLILVATLMVPLASACAQNTATAVARCLSFQIQPFFRTDPVYGNVSAYFTTYTGQDLYPPLHDVSGANWVFSQEARPLQGQPGVYVTDYVSVSSIYGVFQYGHIFFNLPTTDSDGDGVPDFLKTEKAVNFSLSGTQTTIYPTRATVSLTGTMTRSAGQVMGQLSFNNGIPHTGNWNVGNLTGTMSYIRSNGVPVQFHLTGVQPDGLTHSWTGGTLASASLNQIDFPVFAMKREDSVVYQMAASFAAQHQRARYVGPFAVVDGLPGTSWPDYTNWVLEVTDPSDADSNGIPDLTDIPKPATLALRRSTTASLLSLAVQPATSYTIQRSTDLKNWNFFSNFVANGILQEIRDTDGPSRAFYRVRFP